MMEMEMEMKMKMKMKIELVISILLLSLLTLGLAVTTGANHGCDGVEWCGDLRIPYPFGIKPGCYLNDDFFIFCNKTTNPPQAFFSDSNIIVTNISLSGELHIMHYTAKDCYTRNATTTTHISTRNTLFVSESSFTISHTDNKFVALGCDTNAVIRGKIDGRNYQSGCTSVCENISSINNGSCSYGCCQLEIPTGLKDLKLEVKSFKNHTGVMNFNPCGYAFVIQQDKFNFSSQYIRNFSPEKVPLVLDWAIANNKNNTCLKNENKTNCNDDVCGGNSRRISFLGNGSEYRCQCLEGYQGNPYLPHGCQDIDECKDGNLNDCKYKGLCVNTEGNYTCNCPKDYEGDGRRGGDGCDRKFKSYIHIIIGIGVGLIVLLIGSTCLFLALKKWRFIKLKEKFFEKNGGLILQQHLSKIQGPNEIIRIFSQEELKKATRNYDETSIVGKGGFGIVYKGVLEDGLTVAIKISKLIDQSQTDQFINEVIVLSQIRHRNVVRLFGCCLETKVPLLVYEFVSNGTLFDHIHNKTKYVSLTWEVRLRIASETAGVLSYLHSSASTPIIHRDIKPTNILLDDNFIAKVSDFGASKLVPSNHTEACTMVQGTLGYLDPEYLQTSELTEKSDVYSFGIVLLELITGKNALSYDGPEDERHLAMYVLCAMKEDSLEQVVEKRLVLEANFEQIKETAKLAQKCLKIKGDERPTMKEVAMELERLRLMVDDNLSNMEEVTYMREESTSESSQVVVNDTITATDDSITTQIISQVPVGR